MGEMRGPHPDPYSDWGGGTIYPDSVDRNSRGAGTRPAPPEVWIETGRTTVPKGDDMRPYTEAWIEIRSLETAESVRHESCRP